MARDERHADDEGVDEDARGQREARLLDHGLRVEDEFREDGDHDGGRRDDDGADTSETRDSGRPP